MRPRLTSTSGNYLIFYLPEKNSYLPKAKATTEFMLQHIEEINQDFSPFEIIQLSEEVIELCEGSFHQDTGPVIRFVDKKM